LLGVLTGFLILSFYSVIGGFTIGYAVQTIASGLPAEDGPAAHAAYQSFLASPERLLLYHLSFMTATALVVARGVAGGIETAAKILMPFLTVLMLALTGYAIVEGDIAATLRFLFQFDLRLFQPGAALEALGLGFFSIGVGMGLMITYAAYGRANVDLVRVAVISVTADTAISFLAGLMVFPIVFAHGLDPAGGPGLVFVTLPLRVREDAVRPGGGSRILYAAFCRRARFGDLDVGARGRVAGAHLELDARPSHARGGWCLFCIRHSLRVVVQYLVDVVSVAGFQAVSRRHGVRPSRLFHIESAAAARGPRHRALCRVVIAAQRAGRRASAHRQGCGTVAGDVALRGAGRHCSGDLVVVCIA
jgi:hypothetical protein